MLVWGIDLTRFYFGISLALPVRHIGLRLRICMWALPDRQLLWVMQACLFGARGMEGLLVLGTYTARLLSVLSEHRVLFAYVPEVHAFPNVILTRKFPFRCSVLPALNFMHPSAHHNEDKSCPAFLYLVISNQRVLS